MKTSAKKHVIEDYLDNLSISEKQKRRRNILSLIGAILLISITAYLITGESDIPQGTLKATSSAVPVMPQPVREVSFEDIQLMKEKRRILQEKRLRHIQLDAQVRDSFTLKKEEEPIWVEPSFNISPPSSQITARVNEILQDVKLEFPFDDVLFAADSSIIPHSGVHPDNGIYVLSDK